MKTINFKLSKRLNNLGLLDNVETEYIYADIGLKLQKNLNDELDNTFKTLTLEEAIELISNIKGFASKLIIYEGGFTWYGQGLEYTISDINLLKVTEGFIEYILDNNLLNK